VESKIEDESVSMDGRVRAALEQLIATGSRSAQRFSEELAILKRWYYRTHKVGEVFFANQEGELPMRRIVRGVGRVYRGEKELPAEAASPLTTRNEPNLLLDPGKAVQEEK
jgi:hypothetical protein